MIKDRQIHLEGANNVRDLGGVHTADGREVRSGRLFRADALHKLTDADMQVLEPLGIVTIMDFRSDQEIEQTGKARLVEQGANHLHIPLMGSDPSRPEQYEIPPSLGELYQMMARHRAERFAEAINQLVLLENMPVMFHCAAGKDRTGITAAMIYSMLGVDRETIVADYVLTDAAMERVIAGMGDNVHPEARQYPASYMRAEAVSITLFLDTLDTEFGSPEEWLLRAGVEEASFDRLHEAMLT